MQHVIENKLRSMDNNKEGVQMSFPGLTSDCLALDTLFKLLLGEEWRFSSCKR